MTETGPHEIVLPFNDKVPQLANNKKTVFKRFDGLKGRYQKDNRFNKDDCECMSVVMGVESELR